MTKNFQITVASDSSYAGIVGKVNLVIDNDQNTDAIIGVTNASAQAYTDAQSSYEGDPNHGTVNLADTLAWDAMTETQKQLFVQFNLGAGAPFASASIPSDLVSLMESNAGPVEPWNWSYVQSGVVPGAAGVLPIRDVMVGTKRITGALLPVA